VIGHHVHLYERASTDGEALAWRGDEPLVEVGKLLAAQRAASRAELNAVTGLTAARVLTALLTRVELETSLPGPLGLPGGYPVRLASKYHHCAEVGPLTTAIAGGGVAKAGGGVTGTGGSVAEHEQQSQPGPGVELRLPAGISIAEAVRLNQRWALLDGAAVDGGRVVFSDDASAELAAVAPELAAGFDLDDLDAVTERMHELRDQLRGRPCPQ